MKTYARLDYPYFFHVVYCVRVTCIYVNRELIERGINYSIELLLQTLAEISRFVNVWCIRRCT